ncbi:Protein Wnt-2 [Toxocara canis]|uniref:Protein Wnt n=1 Tax=Toxocara canis TaxID=6265 RepID=A0A0B2W5G2_TOXCA|nr:Protein Wnt-2 [Toxocara canis]
MQICIESNKKEENERVQVKGLINSRTFGIVSKDPALVTILKEALHDALAECSQRSHVHRWNCAVVGSPHSALFPSLTHYGTREFAYFLALSTASAVRAIARACAMGRLRSCSCDPSKAGPLFTDQRDIWASCAQHIGSDNLRYAIKLSKRFIDRQFSCPYRDKESRIYLHNIAVGRTRVRLKTKCECVSAFGSCLRRRCSARVEAMSQVGDALMESLSRSRRIRRSNTVSDSLHGACTRTRREHHMKRKVVPLWFVDTGRRRALPSSNS